MLHKIAGSEKNYCGQNWNYCELLNRKGPAPQRLPVALSMTSMRKIQNSQAESIAPPTDSPKIEQENSPYHQKKDPRLIAGNPMASSNDKASKKLPPRQSPNADMLFEKKNSPSPNTKPIIA